MCKPDRDGKKDCNSESPRAALPESALPFRPRKGDPWNQLKWLFSAPVNGASLAIFRIAAGLLMLLEAYSLCRPSPSSGGKIPLEVYYTGADISFTLPYAGFEWLPLAPASWIYALVGLLALSSFTLALGLAYRVSAVMVFIAWGYFYAIECTRTYWMSYYYLELLVTFLLIWMPAARRFSLDALLTRKSIGRDDIPFWPIALLRAQLVIAYFYAGVAKLNADWLLDGMPVRWFLAKPHVSARLEPFLPPSQLAPVKEFLEGPHLAYFLSYTGAFFDLTIGFLLLIRRTRIFGLVLLLVFHGTNHFLLFDDIGWFPLLGVATSLIFLDPDWPQRFWAWARQPQFIPPNWRWFFTGGALFPIVGASLGWRFAPTPSPSPRPAPFSLRQWVTPCVAVWVLWQIVIPIRHLLIPGDARFTWEGLMFSWRLKAEYYRSVPCEISLHDEGLISRNQQGRPKIRWDLWPADKVIHRAISSDEIQWAQLPEIFVVSDPLVGERVLYNPMTEIGKIRSEAEARGRATQIWRELYKRPPGIVHRTSPLSEIIYGYATALRARGVSIEDPAHALALLTQMHGLNGNGQMIPILRRMHPFALQNDRSYSAPFLLIEDPELLISTNRSHPIINRALWTPSEFSRSPMDNLRENVGGEPLVIYMTDLGLEAKDLLPQAALADVHHLPGELPFIHWNLLRNVTASKGMHLSIQPFLLRRYARRIADSWQAEHGRRPAVRARTGLSLNGRPFQPFVEPTADLAYVSKAWFGHNDWICHLETPRIPADALRQSR